MFTLLGNSIGRTFKVAIGTVQKKDMEVGRVKVLLDNRRTIPVSIPLWAEDVKFYVEISLDDEEILASEALQVDNGAIGDDARVLQFGKEEKG